MPTPDIDAPKLGGRKRAYDTTDETRTLECRVVH
jgi:hypothetical protein